MSLFDRSSQARYAASNPAPFFPASIGESLQSSWDVVSGAETSFAFHNMEYEMFERYRGQIEELTGDRFYNPLDHQAEFTAEAPGGFELQMEQWFEDLRKLREKNPGVPQVSMDTIMSDIAAERQKLREQRAEVAGRETDAGNAIAAFAGGAGAAVADPLILGSLALGAPASAGVLRAAVTEALVGAGSEVAVQGAVQATRERLGEGADFGQAATNILLAGAGGGLLAGMFRGGAAGVRALLKRSKELPAEARTPDVQAAERVLQRQVEVEEANPFGPTLAGRVEHARRLEASLLNLTRPLRETLRGDTAVARALPLDTLPDLPTVRPSESIYEYTERVRVENSDLFQELDAVNQRVTEVDTRTVSIREQLDELPEGDPVAGERLATLRERVQDLEGQRQSTAVRRKLVRNRRNLEKLEQNPAAKAHLIRRGLSRELEDLQTEAKALRKRTKELERGVKKAVKNTPRREVPTNTHVLRALDEGAVESGDREIAGFMAELGRMARENAVKDFPFSSPTTRTLTRRDVFEIDPELEKVVKDPQRVDAELARAVDENPDDELFITDPETGETRTMTVREIAEDIEGDEQLQREFLDCIERALP